MTYVSAKRRKELDKPKSPIVTPDGLAYVVTKIALSGAGSRLKLDAAVERYLGDAPDTREAYMAHIVVLGVLHAAADNLRRRNVSTMAAASRLTEYAGRYYTLNVAPIDDANLNENGDIKVVLPKPKRL
jgi:hypothetical protein